MLKDLNIMPSEKTVQNRKYMQAFSPVTEDYLPIQYLISTNEDINEVVDKASVAFTTYRSKTAEQKARFLETIADEILALGDELIQRAMLETGLTEGRLTGERGRTIGQLQLFAGVLREGSWVEAVIDPSEPGRKPLPRADLRKMLVPIGPVAVFGASNFPLAFSTAGGDTASALAAGNPVVLKAHNSHLGTNELVGSAVLKAVEKCNMPAGVFSYIIGDGATAGLHLVKNEGIKAVGFTGSYFAGMSILKAATNERKVPIPVFAEMSSINPVLLLPGKMQHDKNLATQLAASITLGVGQFCTNPGLLFVIDNEVSGLFINELTDLIARSPAATMLNPNICTSYYKSKERVAGQRGVSVLFEGEDARSSFKASPFLTQVNANDFISNPDLQDEIFGPASLIVKCKNKEELLLSLRSLEGQLTATILADNMDIEHFADCIEDLLNKVGRVVYNGVPTGVEVCHSMVHGGPFPATSNANSTSVGSEAIKRFVRPMCFQDCPESFLPLALKSDNPLNIMRKVNGTYTKDDITVL